MNRIHRYATDLIQPCLGSANGPQRSNVSVGLPRKDHHVFATIFSNKDFIVLQVERHSLRTQNPGMRSLNNPDRSFFSFGVTAEYKQGSREVNGYDHFIMHGVVGDAMHGPA